MNNKPILDRNISLKDFKEFYWLKEELMVFCREIGLKSSGGKIDITSRIIKYLQTGKITQDKIVKKIKLPKALHPITPSTVVGVEYRTYQEKKDFFQGAIGKKFHFTTHLLNFIKDNVGKKTYQDVVNEWHAEQKLRKNKNYQKEIAPQFEYNTYIRDFLKNNPGQKDEAIRCWNIKKTLRGDNIYNDSDRQLNTK
ncbi:MAG: DUF6434 domain-containing protein [Candidatus Falkowbacteria bacterium]